MEINSCDFYEHHNGSYFCKAFVKDGHVTQLYHETGRDGGAFWFHDMPGGKGPQSGLTMLGRHFGSKFYAAVVAAAPKDKLTPLEEFLVARKADQVAQAERELKDARQRLGKAQIAYKKATRE